MMIKCPECGEEQTDPHVIWICNKEHPSNDYGNKKRILVFLCYKCKSNVYLFDDGSYELHILGDYIEKS